MEGVEDDGRKEGDGGGGESWMGRIMSEGCSARRRHVGWEGSR